jgi:hypothetical protein
MNSLPMCAPSKVMDASPVLALSRRREALAEGSHWVENAHKKRAGAWKIDFVRISQKAPSGRFTRRPLNLKSHNHNQRDRRPCFSLAVQTAVPAACKRMNAKAIPLYETARQGAR